MENRCHVPGSGKGLDYCPRGQMNLPCRSLRMGMRTQKNKAFVSSREKSPSGCIAIFVRLSPSPFLFFSQGMEDTLTIRSSRQSKVSFIADFLFQANVLCLT